MNAITKEMLVRYAKASVDADRNHKIMCGNPTSKEVDECADRMVKLGAAEEAVHMLDGQPDLPKEVLEFFEVHKVENQACMTCWVSSNPTKIHKECKEKIDRYFRAREALVKIGLNLSKEE